MKPKISINRNRTKKARKKLLQVVKIIGRRKKKKRRLDQGLKITMPRSLRNLCSKMHGLTSKWKNYLSSSGRKSNNLMRRRPRTKQGSDFLSFFSILHE